jgi:glycosyltransferase involved in cell wall biosynthesis
MKKIKVVLICHFSNAQVREQLSLDNRILYSLTRRLLNMPSKNTGFADIAPWDTHLISFLSKRENIDLHVISAHTGLKKMQHSFKLGNVHYYFVKADYTTLMKKLIRNDNFWRKMNPMRFVVRKLVDKISPDIVNLIGAENAYISGTVLDIHKYPVFVLCQTIYNNPDRSKYGIVDSKNASTEMLIFNKEIYFGVYSKMHYNLLLKNKPDAIVFDFNWPTEKLPAVKPIEEKIYDFVNFAAGLSLNKGFHDSIQALAIVKKRYPNVKLNLVGGGDSDAKQELEFLIKSLELKHNVVFTSFFEKQEDMFQHLQYSRFAVLPCKMDNISGTMLQAMYYGLPLVVYKTTGTPSLNKDNECVLISEHSDVKSLAENMLLLMENPHKAQSLRQNAREYMNKTADNDKIVGRLVADYKAIIEHYRQNIAIPQDLLFKLEKQ